MVKPGRRKFVFAASTSVLIIVCGCIAAGWRAFGVQLGTVIGGLLGALAIYTSGNVVTKHVTKATAAKGEDEGS